MVEGDFITAKNRTIETDITRNIVGNKITNETVVSQISKVLDQNLSPLSRKFLELIPEESLTNVHPLVKNLFAGKIPNLQLVGRLVHFRKNWEKLTQDQEIFACSKGARDTILENSSTKDYPKAGINVQNTGIVNRSGDYGNAGQRNHKKSGTSIPRSIPE